MIGVGTVDRVVGRSEPGRFVITGEILYESIEAFELLGRRWDTYDRSMGIRICRLRRMIETDPRQTPNHPAGTRRRLCVLPAAGLITVIVTRDVSPRAGQYERGKPRTCSAM